MGGMETGGWGTSRKRRAGDMGAWGEVHIGRDAGHGESGG